MTFKKNKKIVYCFILNECHRRRPIGNYKEI